MIYVIMHWRFLIICCRYIYLAITIRTSHNAVYRVSVVLPSCCKCPRCNHIVYELDKPKNVLDNCVHMVVSNITQGDLVALGTELSRFWSLKKLLASDAEPPALTHLLQLLTPHALGMHMCGFPHK